MQEKNSRAGSLQMIFYFTLARFQQLTLGDKTLVQVLHPRAIAKHSHDQGTHKNKDDYPDDQREGIHDYAQALSYGVLQIRGNRPAEYPQIVFTPRR